MTLPEFETYFEELKKRKGEESSDYKDRYGYYQLILETLANSNETVENNLKTLSDLSTQVWQKFGHYSATVGISWLFGYNKQNSDVFDNFSNLVVNVVEEYRKDPNFYRTQAKKEKFAFVERPKPKKLSNEPNFEDSYGLNDLKDKPTAKKQQTTGKPSYADMAGKNCFFPANNALNPEEEQPPLSHKEKRKRKKAAMGM